ncbi:MAG TPA: DUF1996 domain-containing protein [Candidatus Limnocylindria bacterium]|nr:DUF1996 domain-containing protein [Candidatus Limnocylindria bacterium]
MPDHRSDRSPLPAAAFVMIALVATVVACLAATRDRVDPGAERGSFAVRCDWSHNARIDPILAPGRRGASHLHAFFGSRATSAAATRDELIGSDTTCEEPRDTAAVWVPTAVFRGEVRTPEWERTYYFGRARRVDTLPPDLKMVAGNSQAGSPQENPAVTWSCGNGTPVSDHPYDCRPFRDLRPSMNGTMGRIDFPSCWDGSELLIIDPAPDDRRGRCEDGEHRIPELSVRVQYGVMDPCDGAVPCGPDDQDPPVALSLSSGPYYTLHADFWNTWHQPSLDRLVRRCLNRTEGCGSVPPNG